MAPGESLFDKPSRGLTLHLRYMHYQLDPTSSHCFIHYQRKGDVADPEGKYQLGAHRLPLGEMGRNTFLWQPLDVNGWGARTTNTAVMIRKIHSVATRQLKRTEDIMMMAGAMFNGLSAAKWFFSGGTRMAIPDDLMSIPLWQLSVGTYYQLACRRPYLRQIQALMIACHLPRMTEYPTGYYPIRDAVLELRMNMLDFTDTPLPDSVRLAKLYKAKADISMKKGDKVTAIGMYARSIKQLLPWFPSEYYMTPWEARLNGVAPTLIKSNINLALTLISLGMWRSAFAVANAISALPCITNWEKSKVLHIQFTAVIRMERGSPINPCELEIDSSEIPENSHYYRSKRDFFLARPRGGFANPPEIICYSPEEFAEHYQKLQTRLEGKVDKWWLEEKSTEAANVIAWNIRMAVFKEHAMVNEQVADGECKDLEEENAFIERTGRTKWTYRVELEDDAELQDKDKEQGLGLAENGIEDEEAQVEEIVMS